MKNQRNRIIRLGILMGTIIPTSTLAQEYSHEHSKEAMMGNLGEEQFSPYAGRNYPTQVYWGDQHLHTEISVEAGTMCRLGQEDAYRFAMGEEVTATGGVRAQLSRPLDWLVISDHAEMYGLMPK